MSGGFDHVRFHLKGRGLPDALVTEQLVSGQVAAQRDNHGTHVAGSVAARGTSIRYNGGSRGYIHGVAAAANNVRLATLASVIRHLNSPFGFRPKGPSTA